MFNKNIFRQILAIILTVALCFSSLVIGASATDNIVSGACGDNLTWSLDTDTGELNITGTGAMTDWLSSPDVPWDSYRSYIKTVNIGNGVTSINSLAVYVCDSLINITVDANNKYYSNDSYGVLFNKDKTELIGYPAGNPRTSYTIPDSVTTIYDAVFWDCDSLTNITVATNNKNYSSDSYGVLFNKNKTTLIQYPIGNPRTSYTIPDSVTTIGRYAFSWCDSLTNVTIPDSVTTIGKSAFDWCNSLTSITIPNSVITIGEYVLYHCGSLTSITVDANNKNYSSDSYGVLFNKDKTTLIQYPAGNTRTSYTIPDSVTTIGNYAFEDCDSLTSVTIPDSVTTIGYCAFQSCNSLTSVTIPDSVTTIGEYAFNCCYSLRDVYYGSTEEDWNNISIGSGNEALLNAAIHLSDIVFGNCGENLKWSLDTQTGVLNISGTGAMEVVFLKAPWRSCSDKIKTINIEKGVTSISDHVFQGCQNLTSVTISDSVTTIGEYAFDHCSALTNITIPDSVTLISDYAFHSCGSLTDVYYGSTEEDWNKISIGSNNESLSNAAIHYGKYIYNEGNVIVPYFKIGDQVVFCAETDKKIPENEMIYREYTSDQNFDFLLPMFSYFEFENVEKKDKTYQTLQQAIWYKLSGDETRRNIVGTFLGEEYLPLFDALISAEYIDENIHLKTYISDDDNYQMMVGYYVEQNVPLKTDDVEAFFTAGCFDENIKELELKVSPVEKEVQPGGVYIVDRSNKVFVGCFDIKIVSKSNPDETVKIREGYEVTIRFPIPDAYKDNSGISIVHRFSDGVNAEKFVINPSSEKGEKQLRIVDGYFEFEVSSFSEFEIYVSTDIETTVKIENKTENKTINYRDQLQLTASVENMPANGKLAWFIGEKKVAEGDTYISDAAESNFEVTVKVVDSDDNVLLNEDGTEIADGQRVTVKAGFWQKLISFFKNLFRISRVVVQALDFAK